MRRCALVRNLGSAVNERDTGWNVMAMKTSRCEQPCTSPRTESKASQAYYVYPGIVSVCGLGQVAARRSSYLDFKTVLYDRTRGARRRRGGTINTLWMDIGEKEGPARGSEMEERKSQLNKGRTWLSSQAAGAKSLRHIGTYLPSLGRSEPSCSACITLSSRHYAAPFRCLTFSHVRVA